MQAYSILHIACKVTQKQNIPGDLLCLTLTGYGWRYFSVQIVGYDLTRPREVFIALPFVEQSWNIDAAGGREN